MEESLSSILGQSRSLQDPWTLLIRSLFSVWNEGSCVCSLSLHHQV